MSRVRVPSLPPLINSGMAYEASEISTAVALQFSQLELEKIKESKDQAPLQKLIRDGIKIAKTGKMIQFGEPKVSTGFIKKLIPTSPKAIADMAVGISAAIGIRKYINKPSGDITVYMTGNTWPKDVEDFKVSAFGFTDYNSSDIIVRVTSNKKKFYGVSLKKKATIKAGDPTLINKAFSSILDGELIKDPEQVKAIADIKESIINGRINFFANVVREAIEVGNGSKTKPEPIILKKDVNNYETLKKQPAKIGTGADLALFESKGINRSQFGTKGYINTKGYANAPKDGYLYDKTTDPKSMRYFVNRKLSAKENNKHWDLYKTAVENHAQELGDILINIILKTRLYDKLSSKKLKDKEFDFSLITGIADVTSKGEVRIQNATVQPLKTTLCGLKRIENKTKGLPYKVAIDTAKSAKSNAAKIFLTLTKGDKPILDLRVRYGGTFTAKPQFQGGMTSTFKEEVAKECGEK